MRLIQFMTCAAIFTGQVMVRAQEAADVDLQAKQTPANVLPTPAGPVGVPELAQLDEIFKQTSVGKEGDEQRLRIEWRQLKNQVMNEPDLVATKYAAEAARTDLKKREYLRKYYKLYFAKVRLLPMSPEMKQRIEGMETGALGSTAQSRVRPSPSPSPSPPN
jgi:hypothetical protein